MVAVPAEAPVTTPAVLTVAMAVLPLLQVPPEVASVKVVFPEMHTLATPPIVPADGAALTVTTVVR